MQWNEFKCLCYHLEHFDGDAFIRQFAHPSILSANIPGAAALSPMDTPVNKVQGDPIVKIAA